MYSKSSQIQLNPINFEVKFLLIKGRCTRLFKATFLMSFFRFHHCLFLNKVLLHELVVFIEGAAAAGVEATAVTEVD